MCNLPPHPVADTFLPVRTKFEFDFVTTATPDQVVELMTDFSPNRPHRWPASSEVAFEVYHLGETDAEIREGQDFPKRWARWRYDWSTPNSVTLTIVQAEALAAGRLHDVDGVAPSRGRKHCACGVGPVIEEPQRADPA